MGGNGKGGAGYNQSRPSLAQRMKLKITSTSPVLTSHPLPDGTFENRRHLPGAEVEIAEPDIAQMLIDRKLAAPVAEAGPVATENVVVKQIKRAVKRVKMEAANGQTVA